MVNRCNLQIILSGQQLAAKIYVIGITVIILLNLD